MVSNDQELVYSEPISILEITKDQEHTVIVMDTEKKRSSLCLGGGFRVMKSSSTNLEDKTKSPNNWGRLFKASLV